MLQMPPDARGHSAPWNDYVTDRQPVYTAAAMLRLAAAVLLPLLVMAASGALHGVLIRGLPRLLRAASHLLVDGGPAAVRYRILHSS